MRFLKTLGRAVGYLALRLAVFAVPRLSISTTRRLGALLGRMMWALARRRREIADRNLRIAYGSTLTPSQRRQIARKSFENLGMIAVETIKVAHMSEAEVEDATEVTAHDAASVRAVFDQAGGAIFVSAHHGCFDLALRYIATYHRQVVVVYRAARDVRTTELMNSLRRRNGIDMVRTDQAARTLLRALRNGGFVALLADQNATDVIVPFFGRPTGTVSGPARLALKTGTPIIVGVCERGATRYRIALGGIITPDKNRPEDEEVLRITSEINAYLEGLIRRHPEQWFWCHNRWRSSPKNPLPEEGPAVPA